MLQNLSAAAVTAIDPRLIYRMPGPPETPIRFEWHPGAQKLYMIRTDRTPERGELIAAEVKDQGAAHMTRLIFLRGWTAARTPDLHLALRGE